MQPRRAVFFAPCPKHQDVAPPFHIDLTSAAPSSVTAAESAYADARQRGHPLLISSNNDIKFAPTQNIYEEKFRDVSVIDVEVSPSKKTVVAVTDVNVSSSVDVSISGVCPSPLDSAPGCGQNVRCHGNIDVAKLAPGDNAKRAFCQPNYVISGGQNASVNGECAKRLTGRPVILKSSKYGTVVDTT